MICPTCHRPALLGSDGSYWCPCGWVQTRDVESVQTRDQRTDQEEREYMAHRIAWACVRGRSPGWEGLDTRERLDLLRAEMGACFHPATAGRVVRGEG